MKSNIQNFLVLVYFICYIYHSLRKWCWIEQLKSGSRAIYVLLILSFSIYRCYGNIDFTESCIKTNFNPKPITGTNFTSIRLREDFLRANSNVRYGLQKTVSKHLKVTRYLK